MTPAPHLRLVVILAGAGFAAVGSYLVHRHRQRSELVDRSGTLENAYAPLAVEVEWQGNVVARVTAAKGTFHFGVPRRVPTEQLADELSFFVDAPCGRRRLDFVSAACTKDATPCFETLPFYAAGPPDSDLTVRNRSSALIVDNRSLPAGQVSAGQVSLDVAADHVSRFTLFLGSCPPSVTLRWQGQEIGEAVRSVIVDPSGSRCYALRHVRYSASWMSMGAGDVKHLAPAKVHPVDGTIDYLFEKAPESIESNSLSQDKDELTEEDCP
jgi:hypothetical protein